MTSVAVATLTFLLGPVVIGWMFLILKTAFWVVRLFNRADGSIPPPGETVSRAGGVQLSHDVTVSPPDDGVCTAAEFYTATSANGMASEAVDDTEVWDTAMKNALWEEFYGGMGDEEYDNISNYSPR